MDRAIIAQRVATKLFATENAVDAAILEASQLLAGLIEARNEIGFSAVLGTASEVADQPPLIGLSLATMAAGAALRRPRLLRAGVRMLASELVATASLIEPSLSPASARSRSLLSIDP